MQVTFFGISSARCLTYPFNTAVLRSRPWNRGGKQILHFSSNAAHPHSRLLMVYTALSCKAWVLVSDSAVHSLVAPYRTPSVASSKVSIMLYSYHPSPNHHRQRVRRSCVSLRTLLQIRGPWVGSSQRLHRVSPYRRRQNSNQSHWEANCHVWSSF